MKSALAILLVFSFIGIGVFGVFAMGHNSNIGHNGCIASTVQGIDCPKENDTVPFVAFHLDVFRSFSALIFEGNLTNILLLLIISALSIVLGIIAKIHLVPPTLAKNYYYSQFLEPHHFSYQRELTRWLALHENSPAIL